MKIYNNCSDNATIISNHFIDCYMAEANGEFVKIYLYLLRISQDATSEFSISSIADHFNHTEKDVTRALKYWEHMHLLRLDYNGDKSLSGIHLLNIMQAPEDYAKEATLVTDDRQSDAADAPNTADVSSDSDNATISDSTTRLANVPTKANASEGSNITPIRKASETRKDYSLDEISHFYQNPEVFELFFIIETYLKHQLSTSDTNMVLFWYDSLHFSTDLIEYLVEYSISKGHSSIRYMDKIALRWHEENITNVAMAKENAAMHSQFYYGVMKAFGITGRNLVDSEIAYVTKWSKEYAFELPIIQEALARTMATIHQPSFDYADGILSKWSEKQVHTLDDVKRLDAEHDKRKKAKPEFTSTKPNRFTNFNQRQYDYDQLERQLLNTSANS